MNKDTHPTFLNWSSGKDAAMALYYLRQNPEYSVGQLLTTVNSHHNRVSMHGLRRELLEQQVLATGIPFSTIELPEQPDMETYEKKMDATLKTLKSKGFTHSAFGDIFLEDLRSYRETQFKNVGLRTVFPIWKRDTKELLIEFISLGFKAVTVAINAQLLDESFVGRELDSRFMEDLPPNVDPCGENGEFHTFCYDGPIFSEPVKFRRGEKIYREYDTPGADDTHTKTGFWFIDLLP